MALIAPKFFPRTNESFTKGEAGRTAIRKLPPDLAEGDENMFGLFNTNPDAHATRYLAEPGGAWTGTRDCGDDRLSGFIAGTRVATMTGWRPVETIAVGELVMTFDNGPQRVKAVTRGQVQLPEGMCPELAYPYLVPAGALGNSAPVLLLPEQDVMIESDAAEAMTGDPFAFVPAKALVGLRGIEQIDDLPPFEIITLHFASDEIVYAEGGALVLALAALPGEASTAFLEDGGLPAPYTTFTGVRARTLVAALAEQDARMKVAPAAA